MTENQRKCIDWICGTLGIKYDRKNDRQGAYFFIRDNIELARKVNRENKK